MSPFLQRDEEDAAVARVHPDEKVVAGDRADVLDSGRGLEDLLTLSHDGVGALEGRGVRQDDLGEEVTLIFLRQEAARDALAEHSGEDRDANQQQNGDERFADEEAADAHIAIGRCTEDPIEPVEELLQRSLAFFLRLQEQCGERGRKGERVEGRDDDRYGNRYRELLIQSPGNAGDERRRYEYRGEDQCDGDDRPGHFLHRLKCRIFRRKPVLDVMFDGFDDDDRIIDHETDGEHEAKERERVHREPEKREQRKRADQRHGHGAAEG